MGIDTLCTMVDGASSSGLTMTIIPAWELKRNDDGAGGGVYDCLTMTIIPAWELKQSLLLESPIQLLNLTMTIIPERELKPHHLCPKSSVVFLQRP